MGFSLTYNDETPRGREITVNWTDDIGTLPDTVVLSQIQLNTEAPDEIIRYENITERSALLPNAPAEAFVLQVEVTGARARLQCRAAEALYETPFTEIAIAWPQYGSQDFVTTDESDYMLSYTSTHRKDQKSLGRGIQPSINLAFNNSTGRYTFSNPDSELHGLGRPGGVMMVVEGDGNVFVGKVDNIFTTDVDGLSTTNISARGILPTKQQINISQRNAINVADALDTVLDVVKFNVNKRRYNGTGPELDVFTEIGATSYIVINSLMGSLNQGNRGGGYIGMTKSGVMRMDEPGYYTHGKRFTAAETQLLEGNPTDYIVNVAHAQVYTTGVIPGGDYNRSISIGHDYFTGTVPVNQPWPVQGFSPTDGEDWANARLHTLSSPARTGTTYRFYSNTSLPSGVNITPRIGAFYVWGREGATQARGGTTTSISEWTSVSGGTTLTGSSYSSSATNSYIRSVRPTGSGTRNFSYSVSSPTTVTAGTTWQTVTGSTRLTYDLDTAPPSSVVNSLSQSAANLAATGTTRNLTWTASTPVASTTGGSGTEKVFRSGSAQLTVSSRGQIQSSARAYVNENFGGSEFSNVQFSVTNIRQLPAQTSGTWRRVTGSIGLRADSLSQVTSTSRARLNSLTSGSRTRNASFTTGSVVFVPGATSTRWIPDSLTVSGGIGPLTSENEQIQRARNTAYNRVIAAHPRARRISYQTTLSGITGVNRIVTVRALFERPEEYTADGYYSWTMSYSYEEFVTTTVQNPGFSFTINYSYTETITTTTTTTSWSWTVSYSFEQQVTSGESYVTWNISWRYEILQTRTISGGTTIQNKEIRAVSIFASRVVAANGTVLTSSGQQGVFAGSPAVTVGSNQGRGYIDLHIRNQAFSGAVDLYGSIYISRIQLYIVGTADPTNVVRVKSLTAKNRESIDLYGAEFPIDLGISFNDEATTQAILNSIVARLGFPAPVYVSTVPIVDAESATVLLYEVNDPVELEDGNTYRISFIQPKRRRNAVPEVALVFEPDR